MRGWVVVGCVLALGCEREPIVVERSFDSAGNAVTVPPQTKPASVAAKPRPVMLIPPPAEPAPPVCGAVRGVFWECPTAPNNPMPFKTFVATSVEDETEMHLSGAISTYYNYEYGSAQKTHYAIELRDGREHGALHAYISRKDPTADALFALVQDGEPHPMTVVLAYNKNSKTTGIAKLVRFVRAGW